MLFCPKRGNKPCVSDHRIPVALTLKTDVLPVFKQLLSLPVFVELHKNIDNGHTYSTVRSGTCFLCETCKNYLVTMEHFYMFKNKYRLLVLISQCAYNLCYLLSSSGFRKPLEGFLQTTGL